MDNDTTRYDAATIEQVVLTVLLEMQAMITVFERKGLLHRGEVSHEILTMRNRAAGVTDHRRRPGGRGIRETALRKPSARAASSGRDGGAHQTAAPQPGGESDGDMRG
jgi:hypothetical protein